MENLDFWVWIFLQNFNLIPFSREKKMSHKKKFYFFSKGLKKVATRPAQGSENIL